MTTTWLSTPDGSSFTYGTIPSVGHPFDAELRCVAGEVRLPLGNVARGHVHLNAPGRRERFLPLRAEEFVFSVTSAYDELWLQRGRGSLLLVRRAGRRSVVAALSLKDGVYEVITAFPLLRDHNYRRRREVRLWTRP